MMENSTVQIWVKPDSTSIQNIAMMFVVFCTDFSNRVVP